MAQQLRGRRVLVTGASSGIGRATARAVAAAGGRLALLARRPEPLADLARQLDGAAVPADVRDPAATWAAVDAAAEALEGLDAVVNAAGLARPGLVAEQDPADWRAMLEVNVLGTLHVTRAAVGHLRAAGGGDVVNVSSMSGRRLQSPEMGVYAATKAAVHMLSEGLRRELADDRIRVATLSPGLVDTPIFEGQTDPVAAGLRERAPEAGLRPDEVADAVVGVLAAPEHLVHVEVAIISRHQG